MNINQIQYLLAIYKYGSITQAAENLFVSAPSISTSVRNLEQELGCQLLLRHHNGVTFTEEGEEAIQLMKEIDENIQKLHHLQQKQDISIVGEISLGVSLHAKAALLLPLVLKLNNTYPNISVTTFDEKSRKILSDVLQGTLDLGIIHYTNIDKEDFIQSIRHRALTFGKLFEGEMYFVVREGHPLTALSNICMKDILQYPYLNYYQIDFTKAHHKVFQKYNPNYHIIQPTDRDMYRDLLHNSDSVTVMPSINQTGSIKQFTGLVFLQATDFFYHYVIGWLHNSTSLTQIEQIVVKGLQYEAKQRRN